MAEPAQFSGRAPGGGVRSALVVGAILVAFVALAVAKPWDPPPPTPTPSTALLPTSTPTAAVTPAVQPPASPRPTPLGPQAPFTIAPPPAGTTWTAIRWEQLDASNPLARFGPTTRWSGGYASLGDDGAGGTTLWTSADASRWSPVGSDTATTFWPGIRVEAVAPLARRLLAVTSIPDLRSSGDLSAPVQVVLSTWLSDDGAVWQMRGGPIFAQPRRIPGAVLAAGSGATAVIAWNEASATGAAVTGHLAATTDGANWSEVPAGALPSGFTVTDLVAAPGGGFLVSGKSTVDGLASAALLRSDAAAHAWTPVALPQDPSLAIPERASVVWHLVPGSSGLLALGDSPTRELWWWSADGRRWTAAPDFSPVGASGCPGSTQPCGAYADGLVAGDGERIVAVGGAGASAAAGTWAAPDGARWQRLQTLSQAPRGRPIAITLLPGGVLLTDGTGVWFGEAGSTP